MKLWVKTFIFWTCEGIYDWNCENYRGLIIYIYVELTERYIYVEIMKAPEFQSDFILKIRISF